MEIHLLSATTIANTNTQLTIAGIAIKTDAEGRYCLNDFHKAAGGERRHDTREFLSRESTQELVAELAAEMTEKPVNMLRGRNGGTFVAKELVYAYAMWISPAFHLKVIRTFDELHTKGMVMTPAVAQQAVESPETFLARAVLVAQESLDKAKKELAAANAKTIEQAKQIDHLSSLMTVNNFLTKHGYQVMQSNKNKLTSKAKVLTEERGFQLERDREYTFLDQQGNQRTYQPYLFREDVLKDAAEILGLR